MGLVTAVHFTLVLYTMAEEELDFEEDDVPADAGAGAGGASAFAGYAAGPAAGGHDLDEAELALLYGDFEDVQPITAKEEDYDTLQQETVQLRQRLQDAQRQLSAVAEEVGERESEAEVGERSVSH